MPSSILPWEPYTGENQPLPAVPQLAQVLNAQPQAPAPAPGQEQPGFFAKLFGKLQNDPAANMALMVAGARLLQGTAPGQTALGGLANAIMQGATAYSGAADYQKAQARQQELDRQKADESQSLIDWRSAQAEQARQNTSATAEKLPTELDKLRTEAKTARLKLNVAEVEQEVQRALEKQDPGGVARARLKLDAAKAALAQQKAQEKSLLATAKRQSAAAAESEIATKARKTLLDPTATPESRDAAAETLYGKATAATERKSNVDNLTKLVKDANPTWTVPQVAQEVANIITNAKTDPVRAAQMIIADPTSYDEQTVKNARDVLALYMARLMKGEKAPINVVRDKDGKLILAPSAGK